MTASLTGYRQTDHALLGGHWLRGELLGLPDPDWPALAEPTAIERKNVYVVRGRAVVRFADLDWVHRRARLEIGVQPDAGDLVELVRLAVGHGFGTLNLRRLHGWVTLAAGTPVAPLEAAGFAREAMVPRAVWHRGTPVGRELWGVVRDG